jgi:hypothetical protein
MLRRWWVLVVLVLLVGCSGESPPRALTSAVPSSSTTAPVTIASTTTSTFAAGIPDAVDYLVEAVDVVEGLAVFADEIDWPERRAMAVETATAAQYPAELHAFVIAMLRDLKDSHSWFAKPSTAERMVDGSLNTTAQVELIDGGIGYIRMEGFSGSDDQSLEYAETLQAEIGMIGAEACGWIVDLRPNGGGNMWPMIVGLGPLLDIADEEPVDGQLGILGFFNDAQGNRYPWRYHNGSGWLGDARVLTVEEPVRLDRPDPPTAVLISGTTASSGEFTLISLMSQTSTRTFGWPTAGRPSGNEAIPLSDGAVMFVTAATATGRDGTTFDPVTPIEPDVPTGGTRVATDWLMNQPSCN